MKSTEQLIDVERLRELVQSGTGAGVRVAILDTGVDAAHPALDDSAVFFKSGSLYGCKPEPGFECKKFHGNRMNFMNSMVVIESVDRKPPLHYAVVVLSNVLRKNSSEVHQDFASKIHRIMESLHPQGGGAIGISPASE